MNNQRVEDLSAALLHEGSWLYPYRPSGLKNTLRWTFGVLFPQRWTRSASVNESWAFQTECLLIGNASTKVEVRARFLRPVAAGDGEAGEMVIASSIREMLEQPARVKLHLADPGMDCEVEISVAALSADLFRVRARIENCTPLEAPEQMGREETLHHALVSTHLLMAAKGGEWLSLIDPPAHLHTEAEACRQIGLWPVLVGRPGERDLMLAAPIILYDYPQVAPESPGDLFDGTEIDEVLTLRILTLAADEKAETAHSSEKVRALLARTEALSADQLKGLHGACRAVEPLAFAPGQQVRLTPRRRADVFDLALHGKTATIRSVEQDFEGQVYLSVTVDDDPGQDLGAQGQPGHRFFFRPDEVEST